jgi:hypothetical protein
MIDPTLTPAEALAAYAKEINQRLEAVLAATLNAYRALQPAFGDMTTACEADDKASIRHAMAHIEWATARGDIRLGVVNKDGDAGCEELGTAALAVASALAARDFHLAYMRDALGWEYAD